MHFVTVAVPKSARPMIKRCSALALQLNRREQKVSARLEAEDLTRLRGTTIICSAVISEDLNADRKPIPVLILRPTNKKKPTHGTPFWNGSQIVIPELH